MKLKLNIIFYVSGVIIALLLTSTASATKSQWYYGCNLVARKMPCAEGYGDNLFPSEFQQYQLYTGFRAGSFGIETGYSPSTTENYESIIYPGSTLFGNNYSNNFAHTYQSDAKISFTYADLVFFIPNPLPIVECYVATGISRTNIEYETKMISSNHINIGSDISDSSKITFKAIKMIPHFKAGLSCTFAKWFTFKCEGSWEKSSAFKDIKEDAGRSIRLRFANSTQISTGLQINL